MFIILNLAVGGTWPGSPNGTTVFPSTMLVDYVRIYSN
jgi:beta-glucanase (GH16 family)